MTELENRRTHLPPASQRAAGADWTDEPPASRRAPAPTGLTSEERGTSERARREGGASKGARRRAGQTERAGKHREIHYRRLLALYPKDHRREHAEEMVGVLLAAADAVPIQAPRPVAWALRFGQDTADSADLIAGALRIRGRMTLKRIRRARWFSRTVRDQHWSDALAVVSVVAPLLLVVAALAEFSIPQAAADIMTGHQQLRLDTYVSASDLPLAAGAPAITVLALLRRRRAAALVAVATAIGLIVVEADPALGGYASPAVAFIILLAGTAAAALQLSPGPARGLALMTGRGAALVGAGALLLGGFSAGGSAWFRHPNPEQGFTSFNSEVAGLPADLLIAVVLAGVALFCLRTPVCRRVLAVLAIPVIPYASLWQEKLAGDLFGGVSRLITSTVPLLYLPPLLLACLIVAGTRLARRRSAWRPAGWAPRRHRLDPRGR